MRSHKGIAYWQGGEAREIVSRPVGHAAQPSTPDPRRASCLECGRKVTYRKRTYGPTGRAGGWTHIGDGLAQYREWKGKR
jgi:hypothetical protein